MCPNNRQLKAKEARRLYVDERTELLETIHEIVVQEVERRCRQPRAHHDEVPSRQRQLVHQRHGDDSPRRKEEDGSEEVK